MQIHSDCMIFRVTDLLKYSAAYFTVETHKKYLCLVVSYFLREWGNAIKVAWFMSHMCADHF